MRLHNKDILAKDIVLFAAVAIVRIDFTPESYQTYVTRARSC